MVDVPAFVDRLSRLGQPTHDGDDLWTVETLQAAIRQADFLIRVLDERVSSYRDALASCRETVNQLRKRSNRVVKQRRGR